MRSRAPAACLGSFTGTPNVHPRHGERPKLGAAGQGEVREVSGWPEDAQARAGVRRARVADTAASGSRGSQTRVTWSKIGLVQAAVEEQPHEPPTQVSTLVPPAQSASAMQPQRPAMQTVKPGCIGRPALVVARAGALAGVLPAVRRALVGGAVGVALARVEAAPVRAGGVVVAAHGDLTARQRRPDRARRGRGPRRGRRVRAPERSDRRRRRCRCTARSGRTRRSSCRARSSRRAAPGSPHRRRTAGSHTRPRRT